MSCIGSFVSLSHFLNLGHLNFSLRGCRYQAPCFKDCTIQSHCCWTHVFPSRPWHLRRMWVQLAGLMLCMHVVIIIIHNYNSVSLTNSHLLANNTTETATNSSSSGVSFVVVGLGVNEIWNVVPTDDAWISIVTHAGTGKSTLPSILWGATPCQGREEILKCTSWWEGGSCSSGPTWWGTS